MRQIKTLGELEEGKYYLGYHEKTDGRHKHMVFFMYDLENDSDVRVCSIISDSNNSYSIIYDTLKGGDIHIGSTHRDYLLNGCIFELTTAEVMLHLNLEEI